MQKFLHRLVGTVGIADDNVMILVHDVVDPLPGLAGQVRNVARTPDEDRAQ